MHGLYRISQYLFTKLKDVKIKKMMIWYKEDMKSKFENLFSECWLPFTEHLKQEMEDDLSISVLNLEFV